MTMQGAPLPLLSRSLDMLPDALVPMIYQYSLPLIVIATATGLKTWSVLDKDWQTVPESSETNVEQLCGRFFTSYDDLFVHRLFEERGAEIVRLREIGEKIVAVGDQHLLLITNNDTKRTVVFASLPPSPPVSVRFQPPYWRRMEFHACCVQNRLYVIGGRN